MDSMPELPDDIMAAVREIRALRSKPSPSKSERENLNRAKLRVAFWACRLESLIASRENLAHVLGADAPAIMNAYDKYLERADAESEDKTDGDKKRSGKGPRKAGGQFWESV